MSTTTPLPPRIRHNSELANKFITEHKISCRYPRVSEQIETLPIQSDRLCKYGYNPSIQSFEGGMLMAYRWHDGDTLRSSLAVAKMDFKGNVLHNQPLALANDGEDPKLFWFNNEMHISWVESTYPVAPWHAIVQYGKLNGERIERHIRPAVPNNDFTTVQKNHVPWTWHDCLYWLYHCTPSQLVFRLEGEQIMQSFETPGPRWAYGQIRGGTPPVKFEDKLIRFFHSGLDNEFGPYPRRYFLGAYVTKREPPFEIVAVSQKPIVYGSEIGGHACSHFKRQVVFPGGAIALSDSFWLVSVGINDSACEILKIHTADLHL